MGKSETNTTSTTTTVGYNATFGVGFEAKIPGTNIGFGGGVTGGWDWSDSRSSAYSITVGQSASFGGSIPPSKDDPNTPEDEFAIWRYSFTPYVYRHHYKDYTGESSGFYVVTYTVNR